MDTQTSLEQLHIAGAQFIFLKADTKRPLHKWRDPEQQYIPTLTDIQNYQDGYPVTLPTSRGERAYQRHELRLAFVPGSLGLLAIDVDIPRYTAMIADEADIKWLLGEQETSSGGRHLLYHLPPEFKDVYSQDYFTPSGGEVEPPYPEEGGLDDNATLDARLRVPLGEIRVTGYCVVYNPEVILRAYNLRNVIGPPPTGAWPFLKPERSTRAAASAPAEIAFEDQDYRDMMDHIRSDSYDDFFRILMALKAGQASGELKDAYALAQYWVNSGNVPDGRSQSPQEGLEHIWNTEPTGDSTMATILYLAQQGGYWIENDDGFDLIVPEEDDDTVSSAPASAQIALNQQTAVAELPVNGQTQSAAVADPDEQERRRPAQRKTTRPHNHRNALRTQMNNLALEHNLAKHLRYDENLVDQDVERLFVYQGEKFFIMNNIIFVANRQLWRELRQGDIVSHGIIKEMLQDSRQSAWWELPDELYEQDETGDMISVYGDQLNDSRLDSRHITDVIRTMMDSINDVRFNRFEMLQVNRRDQFPILPLNDGTSIDLRTKQLLPQDKVLPMLLLDFNWNIMPPKTLDQLKSEAADPYEAQAIESDWNRTKFLLGERYDKMIDRVAMYACGVTKSIDVIMFPSDGGKSTFIDGLRNAFGKEAFYVISSKGAIGPGNKFSNLRWKLASAMGVFVIEIHGQEIQPSDMNIWVEDMQEFEIKFIQMDEAKRIGTVMLVGDEEPLNFSSDNQGFKTRVKWVNNQLELEPITPADYLHVNSLGGLQCLLNEFIERAYQRFQVDDHHWQIRKRQEEEQAGDVALLVDESRDSLVLAMLDLFEKGISLDFLPSGSIVDILKNYAKNSPDSDLDEKKIPTTRQINKPFKKAFGKQYKPIAKNVEGKTTRGYEGFTLTSTGKEWVKAKKK